MLKKSPTALATFALMMAIGVSPKFLTNSPIVKIQPANAQSTPSSVRVTEGTVVKIDGSTAAETVNQVFQQRFQAENPGAKVELNYQGTEEAIKSVKEGKVDLVTIGRPLTDEEKAAGLVEEPLGRYKIAVIVSEKNPFASSLTNEQFAKIFRGEITNWSELGGPNKPISLIDRPAFSDTRQAFSTYPVFQGKNFASGNTAAPVTTDETKAVVENLGDGGIGYAIADQVINLPGIRVLALHQVLPTDKRYSFSAPLYYVYKKDSPSEASKSFLGYVNTPPNQQVITELRENIVIPAPLPPVEVSSPAATATASPGTTPDATATVSPDATASPGTTPSPTATTSPGAVTGAAITGAAITGAAITASPDPNATPTATASPDANVTADPNATPTASPDANANVTADPNAIATASPGINATGNINPTTTASPSPGATAGTIATVSPDTGSTVDANTTTGATGTTMQQGSTTTTATTTTNQAGNSGRLPWWLWLLGIPLLGGLLWFLLNGEEEDAVMMAATADKKASRIILTPRDCKNAYAYWEVSPEKLKQARRNDNDQLALRIHDVTNIDIDRQEPHSIKQYDCTEVGQQDMHVPISQDNRDYLAELGYVDNDGNWYAVVRSTPVRVPACNPDVPTITEAVTTLPLTTTTTDQTAIVTTPPVITTEVAPIDAITALPVVTTEVATTDAIITPPGITTEVSPIDAITALPGINTEVAPTDVITTPPVTTTEDFSNQAGLNLAGMATAAAATVAGVAAVGNLTNRSDTTPTPVPPSSPSRLILVPRSADNLYAYWELNTTEQNQAKAAGGEKLTLRLSDVTGIDPATDQVNSVKEYECSELEQDRHITIPADQRQYKADLGYLTKTGDWLPLVSSSVIDSQIVAKNSDTTVESTTPNIPNINVTSAETITNTVTETIRLAVLAGEAITSTPTNQKETVEIIPPTETITDDTITDTASKPESFADKLKGKVGDLIGKGENITDKVSETVKGKFADLVVEGGELKDKIQGRLHPPEPSGNLGDRIKEQITDATTSGKNVVNSLGAGLAAAEDWAVASTPRHKETVEATPPVATPTIVGESRIILVPRYFRDAYAYWELKDSEKNQAKQNGGEQLILRICTVSEDPINDSAEKIIEFPCSELSQDLHLTVPDSADYLAEIGFKTSDGMWISLAKSEVVHIPVSSAR